MDRNEKLNKWLVHKGLSGKKWAEVLTTPNAWSKSARELYRAATVLNTQRKEENYRAIGPYLMLLGMAVESALKACYVAIDGSIEISDGSWRVVIKRSSCPEILKMATGVKMRFQYLSGADNHRLVNMSDSLMASLDINLSDYERDVLELLQSAIEFGRYPVLKREDESKRVLGDPIPWDEDDHELVKGIIEKFVDAAKKYRNNKS